MCGTSMQVILLMLPAKTSGLPAGRLVHTSIKSRYAETMYGNPTLDAQALTPNRRNSIAVVSCTRYNGMHLWTCFDRPAFPGNWAQKVHPWHANRRPVKTCCCAEKGRTNLGHRLTRPLNPAPTSLHSFAIQYYRGERDSLWTWDTSNRPNRGSAAA